MRTLFINLLLLLIFVGCSKKTNLKTDIDNIEINQDILSDSSIVKFYLPFKKNLEESLMNKPISYSFETYKKNDGELNSTLSNMFADATFEMSNMTKQQVSLNICTAKV